MRHFTWSKENEVFLAQIDAEHREMFRIAEGLDRALARGAPRAEVRDHLRSLSAHAEDHFSHEEWLMQSTSYPSYGWHRQQHDTVRRRLKLFVPLIEKGDPEATDLFLEFLSGWLQDHTGVTDKMMGAYVRNYERTHSTSAFERWGEKPSRWREVTPEIGALPKTIRYCKICGEQSTHEIREVGLVCLKCAERSVSADLDRD
jgi:hemerythrin-like metal-binding protein